MFRNPFPPFLFPPPPPKKNGSWKSTFLLPFSSLCFSFGHDVFTFMQHIKISEKVIRVFSYFIITLNVSETLQRNIANTFCKVIRNNPLRYPWVGFVGL